MTPAARVIRCVEAQLGLAFGEVKPENFITETLGADSLDRIEIVIAIEEEFDILLDDDKADSCATVAELIAMVESALAGKVEGTPV